MPAQPFWKHPAHRLPTLALYKALLQSTLVLPRACVAQPGKPRLPIPGKGVGPPGSAAPIPHLNRTYLFAFIRDRFRFNRHCTSPRITAGYLREAEDALQKLQRARVDDEEGLRIRSELTDMVQGRTGRLKEVIDHVRKSLCDKKESSCLSGKKEFCIGPDFSSSMVVAS